MGKPITKDMHTYDDNCEIELDNILSNFDHYYLCHIIMWFLVSFIVRNRFVLHTWSVLDEIIELSTQHLLPHFRECWWDHIFHDLIFSNVVGIEIGLYLAKRVLKLEMFDWFGTEGKTSFKEWKFFNCHRRFGGVCAMFVTMILNFLTGFFMINSLWINPQNTMNIYRLALWLFLSGLTFRELYYDIKTWGTMERFRNPVSGQCRWLAFFVALAELFISLKFLEDAGNIEYGVSTPIYIWLPWLSLLIYCLSKYLYLRFNKNRTTKYPAEYYLNPYQFI